ncbi:hypothetical protein ACC691_39005, partial [Rhizobium johnstonii]|uniref:ABC transporter permease subunit n=1 Tax=Rhizobium johnstonii TaxID=3019933 RepID=UPI003F955DA9
FVVAILVTVLVWWILNRSSLGFRFRAVGINPNAARVAGMIVRLYRSPNSLGRIALGNRGGDFGLLDPGACMRPGVRRKYEIR